MNKHGVLYILVFLQLGLGENFEKPPRRLIDAPLNGHESKNDKKEVDNVDRREVYAIGDNDSSSEEFDKIKIEGIHVVTPVAPAITGKPGLPGKPGQPGVPEVITQPLPETLKKPTSASHHEQINETMMEGFQIITPGTPVLPGNPGLPGLPGLPGMPGRPEPPQLIISDTKDESKEPNTPMGPPVPQESQQLWVVSRCVIGIPGTPGLPGQPGTPGTPGIVTIVGRNVDDAVKSQNSDKQSYTHFRNKNNGLMKHSQMYLESNNELWKRNWQANGYFNQERRKQFNGNEQQGNAYETISSSGKYDFTETNDASDTNKPNFYSSSSNSQNGNYPLPSSGQGNQGTTGIPWLGNQYGGSMQPGNYQKPFQNQQSGQWNGMGISNTVGGADNSQQSDSSQWPVKDTANRIQPDNNWSSGSSSPNQQSSNTFWPNTQSGSNSPANNNAQIPSNSGQSNQWSNDQGDSNRMNNFPQWPNKQNGIYTPSDSNQGSYQQTDSPLSQNRQPDSYSPSEQPPRDAQQNSFNTWSNGQLGSLSQSNPPSGFYQPVSSNQFENTPRPDYTSWSNRPSQYYGQGDTNEIISNPQWPNNAPGNFAPPTNRQNPDNQQIDPLQQPSLPTDTFSESNKGQLTDDGQGTYNQNQNLDLQAVPYQTGYQYNPYSFGPRPSYSFASNGVTSASSQFIPGSGGWRPMYSGYPGYPSFRPGYPPYQPGYPPYQPGYPPYQPGYQPYRPGIYQPGYPSYQPGYPTYQPGTPGGFTNPESPQPSNFPIG